MSDGVMIAYLPMDESWCRQDLPHMTLVYAGSVNDLKPTDYNALCKDALMVAKAGRGPTLDVTGVEVFGEGDEAVDVLELYPTPALLVARRLVEKWNGSQYKDFRPHATIGPVGSADLLSRIPTRITFPRLGVFFGDKKMVFDLSW